MVDGSEPGVGVGRVVALVVLDVDVYFGGLLLGGFEEGEVVGEEFYGGLGYHDVDSALDGVEGYGVVSCVGGEDGDGVTGGEGVDGGFVGVRVDGVVVGEGVEGGVEVVVGEGDVFVEVLAYSGVRKNIRNKGAWVII